MNRQQIDENYRSMAKQICQENPNFANSVNAALPEAIGLGASIATGGDQSSVAATKAAARVAIANKPNAVAEVATEVGLRFLIEIVAVPVIAVGLVGWGAVSLTKKVGKALSDL